MLRRPGSFAFVALLSCISLAHAANWERFRGPNGTGIAQDKNIPVAISPKENVLWQVAIPGKGHSSPIVWGDKLFLQTAPSEEKRSLLCLSVKDGSKIWEAEVPGVKAHIHKLNSLASATPATDGESVFAAFWDGTDVTLYAYDMKGQKRWHKKLGQFTSQHGAGASPVLYKDKVFYAFDMDGAATMFAFNKKTGDIVWKEPRDAFRACYSIPMILERPGKEPELLVTSTTAITSYDPETGSRNWNWKWTFTSKMPLRTIASSIETDGMLIASSGDGGGDRQAVGIKLPTVSGAAPTQVWDNKKDLPYVPCVLSKDGNLYFVNDAGFAGCIEAKTGNRLWFERLPDAKFFASPVMIDGKMYACSESGDVFVINCSPKFELLARNRLDELIRATPAVADDRLFIRTGSKLYCFGQK
jgi:outer membrane protein assembly factor BamB